MIDDIDRAWQKTGGPAKTRVNGRHAAEPAVAGAR